MKITDVFIIGAGLCGLTILQKLQQAGVSVQLCEKARGSGGRLSSKRIPLGNDQSISFDLGASAFKAKGCAFRLFLEQQIDHGHAAHYFTQTDGDYFVGIPRNSAITRSLVNQDVAFSTRITKLQNVEGIWHLFITEGNQFVLFAKCRQLVLAIPPQQALELLHGTVLQGSFSPPPVKPQWVMMIALEEALPVDDYLPNFNADIALISNENNKPQRQNEHGLFVYTIQASSEFSARHVDHNAEQIEQLLLSSLQTKLQIPTAPVARHVHRWLYAQTDHAIGSKLGHGVWLAGDYCCDEIAQVDGMEAAYINALSVSNKIKLQLVGSHESYMV